MDVANEWTTDRQRAGLRLLDRLLPVLVPGEAELVVRWADGHRSRYRWQWLRDSGSCPACRADGTGQRLLDIRTLPADPRPEATLLGSDALTVLWEPDGHQSLYAVEWLRSMCWPTSHPSPWQPVDRQPAAAPSALSPWQWSDVRHDDEALADWMAEAVRTGWALLGGVPAHPGAVLQVVDRFGYVRQTNYGRIFDVRVVADPANLAYSAMALTPHTDNPYREPPPTLQLLHCLASSVRSGETILVDGFAAADVLQAEHPESYSHLARWPVRWRYGDDNTELVSDASVLELGPGGALVGIRFNERARCPSLLDPDVVDEHLLALRRFAEILDRPARQVRLVLEQGDVLLLDNRRTLHGRTAFAGPGGRHLQGCYVERDSLASRLAVLRRGADRSGEGRWRHPRNGAGVSPDASATASHHA